MSNNTSTLVVSDGFGRTVKLCLSITCFFSIAGLIGYIPGFRILGSVRLDYIPMAPSTAICFLILSAVLYSLTIKPVNNGGLLPGIMTLWVTVYCLLDFIGEFTGLDLNYEKHLFDRLGTLDQIPMGQMSPATSAVFIIASIGTLFLIRSKKDSSHRIASQVASISGLSTILAGSTILLAYLYGTPLMYKGPFIPMAATTAACFLFSGIALTAASGPESFPVNLFTGDSTSARLSRAFIPLAIIFVLVQSIVSNILSASSLVNHAFILAVLVTVFVAITALVISRVAHSTGHAIDKLNQKLQQNEEWHRLILQTAMDGFCMVDLHGRILDVNDSTCKMTGYSSRELLTMNISDIEATETVDDIAARMVNTKAMGEDRFETTHRRKDGTILHVEVSVQFRQNKGGRFIAFFRDITERKQSEEKRIKLQEQLNQSKRIEYVGRLAGGVAHDFNNMLSVIIGFGEMARDNAKKHRPIHDEIKEILEAAKRSADLTRQLLAFARKQTVAPKVLDLNKTVEGMLNMLRRLIGENIDLAWMPGNNVFPIRMDASQLDQLLANLSVNARDAIKDVGKIIIETASVTIGEEYCEEHPESIPGEYALLAVSDNGSGMDHDTLSHLFEPFFTTKEMGKGTGLGLATIYGIVKQNGGFINVYSEIGLGSVFKIYIPRYKGTTGHRQDQETDLTAVTGKETIMVVEDEPSILKMTKSMLEQRGYKVIPASKPSEAISLSQNSGTEIHLVITDVIMPEMNGRDLLKYLRQSIPELKCLFMSGYTANVIAHHGVLDDDVNFIQKPFSINGLTLKVRSILDSTSTPGGHSA